MQTQDKLLLRKYDGLIILNDAVSTYIQNLNPIIDIVFHIISVEELEA